MEITKEMLYTASQAANHQQLRVMYDAMKSERDALAAQVESLREALVELRDVAQRCDSWESFPQSALDAADAALHETPHCAEVKIPTNAEEAAGMALIGMSYLEHNAPEKLTELHIDHLRQVRADAVMDAANEHEKKYGNSNFGRHMHEYAASILAGKE